MKIVFMGTPEFAVQSLKALVLDGHEISAVVTIPDRAQGRGLKVRSSAVKQYAQRKGLSVLHPDSLKDESFISQLDSYKADCFVVVAFRILPKAVFSLPKYGTINVHASLLPAYRGAAPINWAIINGDTKTGVTTMFIDARVDTGDILMQSAVEITPSMNAGELHDLLADLGSELLVKTIHKIETGKIKALVQDDSKATKAPKLNNDNCRIDFTKTVREVYNLIRGLNPYPAAFSYYKNKKVKVFTVQIDQREKQGSPGTIVGVGPDSFSVCCSDGTIKVLELQIEGKRRMAAKDFLNGTQVKNGDFFLS